MGGALGGLCMFPPFMSSTSGTIIMMSLLLLLLGSAAQSPSITHDAFGNLRSKISGGKQDEAAGGKQDDGGDELGRDKTLMEKVMDYCRTRKFLKVSINHCIRLVIGGERLRRYFNLNLTHSLIHADIRRLYHR